ncbi:exsB protein [Haladaptatus paucihalophilus DX253]|uniref:7-cyano-7-deazaguanine synthase n=1 Tax=Haladaptatus paucihalophilus DX253 TaxID=797209 RepID=E7QRL6_HALPU|nr:7-cyano-7-deazaguanine synthase QueC [Haladaptatus paucihalophilus]EFW92635.1 exsB protein [Haladaptatus paucihalophilus DX253]SHK17044.1 preQ(0) biosynthesis protein QueC [Haladaptatus paucihalophilus DX253]
MIRNDTSDETSENETTASETTANETTDTGRPEKRAVILASGGMDSATAAYEARERGYEPFFLHTSYGQRTESKEFDCAKRQADELNAGFLHVETSHLAKIGGSSLTDDEMTVEDADLESDEVPDTYVPFRNANLLSMAVSCAEANDCDAVFIGAHSEDFSGYPDCRPQFFEAFQAVVDTGTKDDTSIELVAPFVEFSKTDIAERGVELDVPYELTWSCYRAEEPACGTCDSCALRLQAFQNVGEHDPIEYEERPSY